MSEALSNNTAANAEPAFVTAENVDISNCELEQVHLVGAIQPHGALLVLDEPDLRVVQASANTLGFLGVDSALLLGQTIDSLLGDDNTAALRRQLAGTDLTGILAHLMIVECLPHCAGRYHLFGNRSNGLLLLEFERAGILGQTPQSELFSGLRDAIQQLQGALSLRTFLQLAVDRMRTLTGFERVMAYRFDVDGSGEVVAEAKLPDLEAYLGLHYPASDIPGPARRLFELSPLRHLPDVDYVPVPLLSVPSSSTAVAPLDLSYSFLRSVSVMYTGYLRNMGVKATLVAPLLSGGKLWGLLSCMHHSEPHYLPFERRIPVEFFAQMLSMLMGDRESLEHCAYRLRLDQVLGQLVGMMGRTETFQEALAAGETNLLSAMDASGVALIADGKLTVLGETPTQDQIGLLAAWLAQQGAMVFSTHRLAHDFPAATAFSAVASGVLSIRLSRAGSDRVIWFRPEVLRDVAWAGDPNKPVEVGMDDHAMRLRPRTSFALWKEIVHGQSRPWLNCEIDYAVSLRQAIIDVIVERARLLARANAELERSNRELDSFAYAASHDLKEPLRGIHNFAEFLQAEDGARLTERGRQRLGTILRLSGRMDAMLESLLKYSRVGRNVLDLQTQAIAALVEQTVELIRQVNTDQNVLIDVQSPLPAICCDRVRVAMIFHNLIMNAIKYNDQPVKKVEVGCDTSVDPPVFFVRDNGIGIEPSYHQLIFQLFRRLHGREEYGGGSGAGLTIVKKAIDRHGGSIWVESLAGAGSTFYFTLAPARDAVTEGP